jgi:hypothetical protein
MGAVARFWEKQCRQQRPPASRELVARSRLGANEGLPNAGGAQLP